MTNSSPTHDQTPATARGVRLLWPVLLGVAAMVMMVLPLLATTGLDNTPINLSKRAGVGLKSADPDLEASADGQWVAVVWSLGYNNRSDTAELGHIVLKSANVITGWEMQVRAYTATSTVWGQQPRMTLSPVAGNRYQTAVTWVECQNQDEQCDTIKMAICDLSTYPDTCQVPQTVHSAPGTSLSNPDIAYDSTGQLHVIWKQGTGEPGDPGLWYQRVVDGTPHKVPGTTANSYNPSLVWSSGNRAERLHLVWYEYVDDPKTDRRIRYSPDTNLTDDTWDEGTPCRWRSRLSYDFTGGFGQPSIKPSIAASGSHVYIAWDIYKRITDRFLLAYEHSDDNGNNWMTECNGRGEPIPDGDATYRSPLTSIDEQSTLRPSIAISGTLPVIAWHFLGYAGGENAVYLIGYRYSMSDAGISWTEPVTLTQDINYDPDDGLDEDDSANPDLALWPGGKVHIGYMGLWGGNPYDENSDWDIYYRGVVITDTSTVPDEPTPTPTPLSPGDPTPSPTVYPYDDLHRIRMPMIQKS